MKKQKLNLDELDLLVEEERVRREFLEMKEAIRNQLLKQIEKHLLNTEYGFQREEAVIIATTVIRYVSSDRNEAEGLLKKCMAKVKLF